MTPPHKPSKEAKIAYDLVIALQKELAHTRRLSIVAFGVATTAITTSAGLLALCINHWS